MEPRPYCRAAKRSVHEERRQRRFSRFPFAATTIRSWLLIPPWLALHPPGRAGSANGQEGRGRLAHVQFPALVVQTARCPHVFRSSFLTPGVAPGQAIWGYPTPIPPPPPGGSAAAWLRRSVNPPLFFIFPPHSPQVLPPAQSTLCHVKFASAFDLRQVRRPRPPGAGALGFDPLSIQSSIINQKNSRAITTLPNHLPLPIRIPKPHPFAKAWGMDLRLMIDDC